MSRYFRAEIADNVQLSKDYNLLTFLPPSNTEDPEPGQFYMIGRCVEETEFPTRAIFQRDIYDPILKRPFSLFRKTAKGLQLLYRVKGRGTMLLRGLRKGFKIDVLGPLGNSYPMPSEKQTPLIMAGGVGVASIFYLAERLAESGKKAHIFYGVRDEGELLMLNELKGFAGRIYISTDDGSCGEKGCITDMAKNFLSDIQTPGSGYSIYSCGPRPMFKALYWLVKDKEIPTYISMEEQMACGIGACLGCVVKTIDGYKRVCKEGPVFNIMDIVW